MWETPGAEVVREATGMQSAMSYIGRQQSTMAKWVVLRPIFEVCKGNKGYEGYGCRREAWWSQAATYKQLWATMAGLSQEAKRRRRLGESVTQQDPEGRGVAGWGVGILGRRQEMPRWANDLVW